jgi:hypothetical protein
MMINFFLSSPAGLCRVLGVSAAGSHAGLDVVVGQVESTDEALE